MAYRSNMSHRMLEDWFTCGPSEIQRKQLPCATIDHAMQDRDQDMEEDDDATSLRRELGDTTEYSEELKNKERMDAIRMALFPTASDGQGDRSAPGSLFDVEDLTSRGTITTMHDLNRDETIQLYAKYKFKPGTLADMLPVHASKDNIVRIIEANQAVIIHGATGSGKTTQVPQFILEYYMQRQKYCNIVVTQPRRIAAISIADRVCRERDWPLGGMVAYQVGLENKCSADTRLRYVTTGVLLQQLVAHKNMNDYTHIFLDEVHERDQDTDFTMLVVKKFLNSNSRGVKVILMSATAETDTFATYFSIPLCGRLEPAPVFKITSTMYQVNEYYLDELEILQSPLPTVDVDKPGIGTDMYQLMFNLIIAFDRLDTGGQQEVDFPEIRGAVLVFLPGLEEINYLRNLLNGEKTKYKWTIIPLHSTITVEEQKLAFIRPSIGFRKIILSTNICESSVTVPDITYVLDSCLTKSMYLDTATNYTSLRLEWASHSNCTQRKGRVGRVAPGRCYRLVQERFYHDNLEPFPTPEMKRCPSEQLVLKAKMLDLGEPKDILGLALDPMTLNDIERAVLTLKEVWALLTTSNGKYAHYDGDLTNVGKILSTLPVDVRLGKLVILGHVFGCVNDCIIIAAGLSLQSFFSSPYNERLKAYKTKFNWAEDSFSDCIAICNAYNIWQHQKRTRFFLKPGGVREEEWCQLHFIQHKRLKDVERLVKELHDRLAKFDIHSYGRVGRNKVEDWLVLRLVICGAFYPYYFTQAPLEENEVLRSLSGKDPMRTVTIKGFPANRGVLYAERIEQIFQECCDMVEINIHFEETKAFVEFGHLVQNSSAKKVNAIEVMPEVYQAVKMRMLRYPMECFAISREESDRRMKELESQLTNRPDGERGTKRLRSNRISSMKINTLPLVPLPGLGCSGIDIFVSHMVDCGHFWAQYKDNDADWQLRELQARVQQCVRAKDEPCRGPITPGKLVLAPCQMDQDGESFYYRARVDTVESNNVGVFCVDFGYATKVSKRDLREVDEAAFPLLLTTPMLAFECKLALVRPRGPAGKWSEDARVYFASMTAKKKLTARVYSVIYDTVRLELLLKQPNDVEANMKDELIRREYAVRGDELLISQQNHEIRMNADASETQSVRYDDGTRFLPRSFNSQNTGNPTGSRSQKLPLHGPSSPLEMSFFSLHKRSMHGSVRIDQGSINSVALNPEPHDKHDRLLVAAQVSASADGTALTARNTTLLPNVHGLMANVCLLFAPKAELRCDAERTRYTGAICGLGHDERGRALYPEHDMEVEFDTVFDHGDLFLVNIVRYGIDLILGRDGGSFGGDVTKNQTRAREQLMKLVFRFRETVPKMVAGRNTNRWMVNEEHKVLTTVQDMEDVVPLLPFLDGISLTGVDVPRSVTFLDDDASSVVSSMDLSNA